MQDRLYLSLRFSKYIILAPVTFFLFFMALFSAHYGMNILLVSIPFGIFTYLLIGMYLEYFRWCNISAEAT